MFGLTMNDIATTFSGGLIPEFLLSLERDHHDDRGEHSAA